jgi:hypothetical protein
VLADQQSRPFPSGTSVIRVAGGLLLPETDDAEMGSVILRGPLAARPELIERASELGFAPIEDPP